MKKNDTKKTIIFVVFPFLHCHSRWINENMIWTKTITLEKGKNINPRVTWSMNSHLQVKLGYIRYHYKGKLYTFKKF